MSRPAPPSRDSSDDVLLFAAFGGLAALALAHWLIGNLAALLGRGRLLHAGPVQAMVALWHLPKHATDPRRAWSPAAAANLPGPVLYWSSAALVTVVLLAAAIWMLGRFGARHEPVDKRHRLGIATQARLATTRDLATLLARHPQPGRLLLARHGRRNLMTEAASYRGRRGVRGAVAVFGPSQSGKTTGLIGGVKAWSGPAIISSVKADLLRATLAAREAAGEVKVFDPLRISGEPTATWSPLRAAATLPGALAAAQTLARSSDPGSHDQFWAGQAEQLLAAMLWVAANTEGHTMADVVKWVLNLDRPADGDGGTLAPLLRLLTDHNDPAVATTAHQVQGWLHGQWKTDPRTTSSVYATARNAVCPWADPNIADSAQDCAITLDWLLAGNNTLYLCAPLGDETRIGVVFAVVLNDLVTQAFDRYNRTGQPTDPRLLVLLDEAANTPLPKLPQWASTLSGTGIQLVTVWQTKAQLDQIYGRDADNVLTNHRTKIFYPSGLSDLATIDYLTNLGGTEHVRGDLSQRRGLGAPNRSASATVLPLLVTSVLRQMNVGDILLLHGGLPPAWVKAGRNGRQ